MTSATSLSDVVPTTAKKLIAEHIVFGAYQNMGNEILMKLKT